MNKEAIIKLLRLYRESSQEASKVADITGLEIFEANFYKKIEDIDEVILGLLGYKNVERTLANESLTNYVFDGDLGDDITTDDQMIDYLIENKKDLETNLC